MAEKKKVLWDGNEKGGLVSFGELTMEKSTIEVPSFHRIRVIQSGITKLPVIELVYRIDRNADTKKFLEDFYLKDEDHDMTLIRTDASGTEFARRLLPGCECIYMLEPAYDAANPTFAKLTVRVVPWDIIFIQPV